MLLVSRPVHSLFSDKQILWPTMVVYTDCGNDDVHGTVAGVEMVIFVWCNKNIYIYHTCQRNVLEVCTQCFAVSDGFLCGVI